MARRRSMHLPATSGTKNRFIRSLRPTRDTIHGLFPFSGIVATPVHLLFERFDLPILTVARADSPDNLLRGTAIPPTVQPCTYGGNQVADLSHIGPVARESILQPPHARGPVSGQRSAQVSLLVLPGRNSSHDFARRKRRTSRKQILQRGSALPWPQMWMEKRAGTEYTFCRTIHCHPFSRHLLPPPQVCRELARIERKNLL
jgi:hypothetical protein